jgi:hypothetical protein
MRAPLGLALRLLAVASSALHRVALGDPPGTAAVRALAIHVPAAALGLLVEWYQRALFVIDRGAAYANHPPGTGARARWPYAGAYGHPE